MNKIRLDDRSIGYINLFSALTNARVRDFINFNDRFVFIVEKGDIGIALGRHGEKIKKIKETIKKNIEVIEHSENAEEFIRSIFHNYKI
ncbi:MAG: NusA-like transcription termination signal-binding factor, partial [Candidatus Thermoplasmatota archaeon]